MSRTDATAMLVALPLAALLACGDARAAQGMLRVGVRVVSATHDRAAELDRLPTPSGATRLTRTHDADSYWCDGATAEVAGPLPPGAVRAGLYPRWKSADGLSATYTRAQQRVDLQLDPVLGTRPATRIVVKVDTAS
jgi:hypothetical protein